MTSGLERFQRDFFPDTERHTLSFEILSDDWQALQQLFAANGWTVEDGLRYALAAGQAYIEGTAQLAELEHPAADPSPGSPVRAPQVQAGQALAAEVARLQRERMQVESRYAVMKFRAYSFMQAAQLLEMKLNACRAELDNLRIRNEQMRQQLDQT